MKPGAGSAAGSSADVAGHRRGLLSNSAMTDSTTIKRIRAALRDHDPEVRAHAVDALVALADATGLLGAVASPDRYVRARAVYGLAARRGWRIGLQLAAAAFDIDADVRCAVVAACAQRRGRLATRVLARLAHDPHAVVRYSALTALANGRWRGVRRVLRHVETHDPAGWVRDAASALLRQQRSVIRAAAATRGRAESAPTLPRDDAIPPGEAGRRA
jgi:hypothetical protein